MRRGRPHRFLAWLCLIWFGLTNTAFAGGLAVCQDGHGGTRLEWGCDRNASGECLTSCAGETDDDPGDPHPCQDTPIEGDQEITTALPRAASDLATAVPLMVAATLSWFDSQFPAATKIARTACQPDRPPDSLRDIRTVVLLV